MARSPLVKCGLGGVHSWVVLPGFGDHDHDSLGQGQDAVYHQQFQDIVKRSRVGTTILHNWVQIVELVTEDIRLEYTLSGAHPILVATESVDFTIVGSPAQWLSTVPGRECVGGETRVDERKVTFIIDVYQVMIVLVHLRGRELALVDNVPVAQRAQIEPIGQANDIGCTLPKHVQLQLKCLVVERLGVCSLWCVSVAVGRLEHDKRLRDDGFPG